MPKKKKLVVTEPVEEVKPDLTASLAQAGLPTAQQTGQPETPSETKLNKNTPVKARNAGAPFVYDLSRWGYGQRWPTGAVYTIPMDVYMDCLKKGMDGAAA